jgi:hypothetical protein
MNRSNSPEPSNENTKRSAAFKDASLGVKRLAIFFSLLMLGIGATSDKLNSVGCLLLAPISWAFIRGLDWVIRGFTCGRK